MKKFLLCYMLTLILILTACSERTKEPEKERLAVIPKSAAYKVSEEAESFKVKNCIAVDIYELYVSPTGKESYCEDILGKGILAQNETAEVFYVPVESCESWDVKALADDGNFYVWHEVKLSSHNTIELYISNNTPTFTVKE